MELLNRIDLMGHERSSKEKVPISADGHALPWYTYPAIHFLQSIDLSDSRIYEFGSGWSSLFFKDRACDLVSVDNDPKWVGRLLKERPDLEILLRLEESTYAESIYLHKPREGFDVVCIDGEFREACLGPAIKCLSTRGFVIVDNSDWFSPLVDGLVGRGFLRIDFSGFGPINHYTWTTSMFFQPTSSLKYTSVPSPIGGIRIRSENIVES